MKGLYTAILLGALTLPLTSNAAFDTDLRYGSSGSPVLELQEFLTAQGVYTGPITGNFFSLTLAGVQLFQAREGIQPTSGFFGPLTRARANILLESTLAESNEAASDTPMVSEDRDEQRDERRDRREREERDEREEEDEAPAIGGTSEAPEDYKYSVIAHCDQGGAYVYIDSDDTFKARLTVGDESSNMVTVKGKESRIFAFMEPGSYDYEIQVYDKDASNYSGSSFALEVDEGTVTVPECEE